MTTPITPSLWFDGQAQEAAEFYVSVLPDSRITGTHRIVDENHPTGYPVGSVLAVSFELEGRPFFALNGGPGFPFTQAVSMQTFVATQEEADARWDALVDGGEPAQCGWLRDRYGLSWQVVPQAYADAVASGDQQLIDRVHAVVLASVKPDVAAVEAAVRGD